MVLSVYVAQHESCVWDRLSSCKCWSSGCSAPAACRVFASIASLPQSRLCPNRVFASIASLPQSRLCLNRVFASIALQRCSGLLSQLLKTVYATSSFGEENTHFASQSGASAAAGTGKSPVLPASFLPSTSLKPFSSPIKPRSVFYK